VSLYADTSLLVPLIARDAFNDRAEQFLDEARPALLISDFAAVEFASALALRVRTNEMTAEIARVAFAAFDAWAARFGPRLETTTGDVARAETFVRRLDLNLRAPDALHIAIAQRHGAALATFDARMADAARALGVEIAAV
jgi:predicted nucleic acid-binding protein